MLYRPGNEADDTVLDALSARAKVAEREEEEAHASLSRAVEARRLWTGLMEDMAHERPIAAFLECERGLQRSDRLAEADLAFLQELSALLRVKVDQVMERMEIDIPEALRSAGLSLDSSARHPNYTMESGFITVTVDQRRLVASISSRGGPSRKEALDPAAVALAAVEVRDRVFGRTTSHLSSSKLIKAYRALRTGRHAKDGEDVPIEAIRAQLSPRGRPIPHDEFNVDLAALIRESAQAGVPKISLSNTRDTRAGLLLHGLEDAGYIGYIRIEGD